MTKAAQKNKAQKHFRSEKSFKQICKKKSFSRSGDTVFVPSQSCEGAPISYSNVTACLSQHLAETESARGGGGQNLH